MQMMPFGGVRVGNPAGYNPQPVRPVGGPPVAGPVPFRPSPIPAPIARPVIGRSFGGPVLGSFKKGGKVKQTGLYKLHQGEKVVPLKDLLRAK